MIKIEGKILGDADVGEKVLYTPPHARSPLHPDIEIGEIRGFNSSFVFVDYGTGHGKATQPEHLKWVDHD